MTPISGAKEIMIIDEEMEATASIPRTTQRN